MKSPIVHGVKVTDEFLLEYGKQFNETDTRKLFWLFAIEKKHHCDRELLVKIADIATRSMVYDITGCSKMNININQYKDIIMTLSTGRELTMFIKCIIIPCDEYMMPESVNDSKYKSEGIGLVTFALINLFNRGEINLTNLKTLSDFGRISKNILSTINIRDGKCYYSRQYKVNKTQYRMKWLKYMSGNSMSHSVSLLEKHNVSAESMKQDIDFMSQYVEFLYCSRDGKDAILCEIDRYKKIWSLYDETIRLNKLAEISLAKKASVRFDQYMDSNDTISPTQYWKNHFDPVTFDEDSMSLKQFYPDKYDEFKKHYHKIAARKFMGKIATINKVIDTIYDTCECPIYQVSMLQYFNCGGEDIDMTLHFLSKVDDLTDKQRKFIGLLHKFRKQLKIHINEKKELEHVHCVAGHELAEEEKFKLFSYMRDKQYPHCEALYNEIAREYVKGNLTIE